MSTIVQSPLEAILVKEAVSALFKYESKKEQELDKIKPSLIGRKPKLILAQVCLSYCNYIYVNQFIPYLVYIGRTKETP